MAIICDYREHRKQCSCGCAEFIGMQVQHFDVVLDENKMWVRNLQCYEAGDPFGPFVCSDCGAEYSEWEDIPDMPIESAEGATS